jgi:HEAT repeat protein
MQSNNDTLNQELINFLRQDELDYPAGAAKFGSSVLPLLQELIKSNDENLATKAAYLAGFIKDDSTESILTEAAGNKFATVRIAAAFGAKKLKPASASLVLKKIMDDNDAGVLKMGMKAVQDLKIADQFKTRLKKISTAHQDDIIRQSAGKLINK